LREPRFIFSKESFFVNGNTVNDNKFQTIRLCLNSSLSAKKILEGKAEFAKTMNRTYQD
jgi:hypothetical protein